MEANWDSTPQLLDFDSPLFPGLDLFDISPSPDVCTESFGYSRLTDVPIESTMSTPEKPVKTPRPGSAKKRKFTAAVGLRSSDAAAGDSQPSTSQVTTPVKRSKRQVPEESPLDDDDGATTEPMVVRHKPPLSSRGRQTTRSQLAAQYEQQTDRVKARLADMAKLIPDTDQLQQKLQTLSDDAPEDSDDRVDYDTMLSKSAPHFTNNMYKVERNSRFSPRNFQHLQLLDTQWFDKNYDFSTPPFTSFTSHTISATARRLFGRDASRPVDYLSSYKYSVDGGMLLNEPAFFYVDRTYAYWCRHPNPRNDQHPVCFRCQLANSLPICFIHTSWPCDFCLLSTWEELRTRTNRICKILNTEISTDSWCSSFHASHKMPAKFTCQADVLLDVTCTKPTLPLSVILKHRERTAVTSKTRAATPQKKPQTRATAATTSTTPTTSSSAKSPAKRRVRARLDKKGKPAKQQCQLWYLNSRDNEKKEPPEYKHRYRKEIYDAVHPNLAYWAARHGKDIKQSAFDKECCARLTYFELRGDRVNWKPVDLPQRRDPLPPEVLAAVLNMRDVTATSTEDEGDDDGASRASEEPEPESSGRTDDCQSSPPQGKVTTDADDEARATDSDAAKDDDADQDVEATGDTMHTRRQPPPSPPIQQQLPSSKAILPPPPAPPSYEMAASSSKATEPTLTVNFNPDVFALPPTIHRRPSLHPFENFVLRLRELDPANYPLTNTKMKPNAAAGAPYSQNTIARHHAIGQPRFPEDDDFMDWVRIREQEVDEADQEHALHGRYPTLAPTRRLQVNMSDYRATGNVKLPMHAPEYPASSSMTGLLADPTTRQLKVYPGEFNRLHEIVRCNARIAQCMRYLLSTSLGLQMSGEVRDCLHVMLDDLYKLDAEAIVNLNRVQQRSSFRLFDYKNNVHQLIGHSVLANNQLFPDSK